MDFLTFDWFLVISCLCTEAPNLLTLLLVVFFWLSSLPPEEGNRRILQSSPERLVWAEGCPPSVKPAAPQCPSVSLGARCLFSSPIGNRANIVCAGYRGKAFSYIIFINSYSQQPYEFGPPMNYTYLSHFTGQVIPASLCMSFLLLPPFLEFSGLVGQLPSRRGNWGLETESDLPHKAHRVPQPWGTHQHPFIAHTAFVLSPQPGQGGHSASPFLNVTEFPGNHLPPLVSESIRRRGGNWEVIVVLEGKVRCAGPEERVGTPWRSRLGDGRIMEPGMDDATW